MRKIQRNIFSSSFFLLLLLLIATSVYAKNDPPYVGSLRGTGIKPGEAVSVVDSVFFNPSLKPTVLRTNAIRNIVSLRLDEYSPLALPDSFAVQVAVRMIYVDKNNLRDSVEKTLSIRYSRFQTYKSRDIYLLQDAYQMQVKVLSVTVSGAPAAKVMDALELENRLQIDRDYVMNPISGTQMDCSDKAVRSVGLFAGAADSLAVYGELPITWAAARAIEAYDVEWTYIDSSALANGTYFDNNGQLDARLLFRNNATRITTLGTTAFIPMLYDGTGSLFFRVRGVQTDPTGERLTTTWSSDFTTGLGRYDFSGHQRKMNWQATTTFAEEAKRKSVVQYFDGSLRSRQTVTRDNTTQTTVVAETFYDKQGRPQIQVLPAPTLSKLIGYTPGLNVFDVNGREYDKGIYDTVQTGSEYCASGADVMSTVSGTAQYYSPNNPLASEGMHQFIPDAKGYAFTETQYTQDNSGRISKQGGVGEKFQLGKGHETKYYYGTPEQSDLDALFGTEAGEASHYQKNMVRDANGQYSVSYVDMHGRTVATALAGDSVKGMQRLTSYRAETQTESLLNATNNIVTANRIESSKALLVTKAGPHTFNYGLSAESLTLQDCQQKNICYDCLYDLTITITDDCNNSLLPGGSPVVITKSNFKLFAIDTTCNTAQPLNVSFNQWLEPGSYNITKVLTISQSGMQYYRDSLYLPHNTCLSYEDILKAEQDSVRQGLVCSALDDLHYEYESFRRDMLADMFPLVGQYGDTATLKIDSGSHLVPFRCYSIFNDVTNNYTRSDLQYLDEDGSPSLVLNGAGQLVDPKQLSKEEFIANFRRTWAEALLALHPEKRILDLFESFEASLKWDEDFKNTGTYGEAKAKGYLNPTGNTTQSPATNFGLHSPDPLFSQYSASAAAKSALETKLFAFQQLGANTFSAWGIASAAAKCPDEDSLDLNCALQWNNQPFSESSLCTGELDAAWKMFQSQYQTLKNDWLVQYCISQSGVDTNALCFRNFIGANKLLKDSGYTFTGNADKAVNDAALAKLLDDNCRAYATRWWEQLQSPCNYVSATDSALVINELIKVCRAGGDENHPFGSSTIKPGSTSSRFKSFEEVIQWYNDMTHRATNAACNGYLLDYPLPYTQSVPLVTNQVVTKPDSCTCTKINGYYNQYLAVVSQYTNFSDYLLKKHSTFISQASLDSLRGLCSGAISCKYISNPIDLPPLLQCNVQSACVSCTEVREQYQMYLQKFPDAVPALQEDSLQYSKNRLFATYMNHQFGFSYAAQDYLQFMQQCNAVKPGCDSLNSIVDSFRRYYFAQPAGTVYGNYRITKGAFDLIAGANALVKARFRTQGVQLPSGYGYAPFNAKWSAKLKSVINLAGSDSEYHAIVPLSRDGAWAQRSIPSLDYNTVLPQDFVLNSATTAELTDKYLAVPVRDRKTSFQCIFHFDQNTDWNSYLYFGVSTPDRKYLPPNKNTFDPSIHYYSFGFFDAGLSVSDAETYLKFYNDSIVKIVLGPDIPYIFLSPFIPSYNIRGIKNLRFASELFPLTNIAQYAQSPKGLKVTLELADGTERDAYIFSTEHECLRWQEAIDSNLYDRDCSKAFTYFFNQRHGTSYSFDQLDALYFSSCGKHLSVCDSIEPSCEVKQADYSFINTYQAGASHSQSKFYDMRTTADGGYLSIGVSTAQNGKQDALVVRKNKKGVVVWSRLFGGSGDDVLQKMALTSDGGLIANGWTTSFRSAPEMWLLKLSADGSVQWSRRYSGNTINGEYGVGVTQTKDGGYAVTANYNLAAGTSDWLLAKMTSSGQIVWSKRMGSQSSDNAGSVIEDGDSLVVTANHHSAYLLYQYYPSTYFNGVVLKVGVNTGQVGWIRSYDIDFDSDWFGDLRKCDSGYAIASNITHEWTGDGLHASMVYLDTLGNMRRIFRNNDITTGQSNNAIGSVQHAADGGFYYLYGNKVNSDLYIQKSAANGVVQWNSRITLPGSQYGYRLVEVAGGGVAIAGNSDSLALLVKTDARGRTQCYSDTFSLAVTNPSYVTYPARLYFDTSVALSVNTVAVTEVAQTTSVNTVCETPAPVCDSGPLLCGKWDPNPPPVFVQDDPCADSTGLAIIRATERYRLYKDSLAGAFEEAYQQKCLKAASLESFTVTHPVSEYHYTLYYYDLAGNLVKTVSPQGVNPNRRQSWLDSVAIARAAGTRLVPQHSLPTTYRYNSLNQVVSQKSPDGGLSEFWYDRLGRLVVSRNAKQRTAGKWSYTKYDGLGRITEVGQKAHSTSMTQSLARDPLQLKNWLDRVYPTPNDNRIIAEQVTRTVYDEPDGSQIGLNMPIFVGQVGYTLRNRVSYTRTYEYLFAFRSAPLYGIYDFGTTYSYDIHGNVDTLLQQYRTGVMNDHGSGVNRFKVTTYQYDLISGKVNEVHYQPGQPDQLYHRYLYDAENRLTDVYTTDQKALIGVTDLEEHDARYQYYKHGPLAKVILGHQQVQGLDYAYTLQGWLKGVNSTGLDPDLDMGADGKTVGVARDAFGFNLNYFTGDYAAISNQSPFPGHAAYMPMGEARELYNGNISSMGVNIGKLAQPQLYNFQYDQLNRLVGMDVYRGYNTTANSWSALTPTQEYKERVSYDANGNILSYLRNGTAARLRMDDMQYFYKPGTNQLDKVVDHAPDASASEYDMYADIKQGQGDGNYTYDEIGNLVSDPSEKITGIEWTVYGKIASISKTAQSDGEVQNIIYRYDAAGNRIGKQVIRKNKPAGYTWYSRDAQGNVMAVYEYNEGDTLFLTEHHLYGSSRLGVWNRKVNMDLPLQGSSTVSLLGTTYSTGFERGRKQYELSNHLGNVLVTISDKKTGVDDGVYDVACPCAPPPPGVPSHCVCTLVKTSDTPDGLVDYYLPDVISAQDYYPFGMLMPGRRGRAVMGGWSTPGSAPGLPATLTLDQRSGNLPTEYKASQEITFVSGFESGAGDEFVAYLTQDGGNGSGRGSSLNGSAGNYRYGFNGKENDNDIEGEGSFQDYGMRGYNPLTGRFWSIDPLTKKYPMLTPYQFASNKPINSIDLDGGESKEVYMWTDVTGKTTTVSVDVSDPYKLGKGTLYHTYTVQEVSYKQINKQTIEVQQRTIQNHLFFPEKEDRSWWQKIGDLFSSVELPQVIIFGTEHSSEHGTGLRKWDPNKKTIIFNYAEAKEMLDLITTGMSQSEKVGEPSKLPGQESVAEKLNKAVDKAQKAADKEANEGKLPNEIYDITPNSYPASTPPNVRRTIVRTDANGNVKDTIKWPSDEMLKKGNSKFDTIPNTKRGN